jgi:hypothetical protein
MYAPLQGQPGYEYFGKIQDLKDRKTDAAFLFDLSPTVMVGTPDDLIERCQEMERRGVDELLIRVDGFDHARHMKIIEMIGRHVLPVVDTDPGSRPGTHTVVADADASVAAPVA